MSPQNALIIQFAVLPLYTIIICVQLDNILYDLNLRWLHSYDQIEEVKGDVWMQKCYTALLFYM